MKYTNTFPFRSRLFQASFFLFIYSLCMGLVQAAPFSKVVSFGDSLSDTGNLYAASSGYIPPVSIYPGEGRFSNGIVWAEYIANDLKVELHDYAYGGAKTDDTNFNEGRPGIPAFIPLIGLTQQVDYYLEDVGEAGANKRDLFLVAVGANDFFDFFFGDLNPLTYGVQSTVAELTRLLEAGARNVVVLNVPDLGNTPEFQLTRSMAEQIAASMLTDLYNMELASALEQLDAAYPGRIVLVDTYGIINEVISNPEDYGMSNVTFPALQAGNPDESLFWDGVHPTTAGHRILATKAFAAIADAYIPGLFLGVEGDFPALRTLRRR